MEHGDLQLQNLLNALLKHTVILTIKNLGNVLLFNFEYIDFNNLTHD